MSESRKTTWRFSSARSHGPRVMRLSIPYAFVVLLSLLALFVQALVVQTHFHPSRSNRLTSWSSRSPVFTADGIGTTNSSSREQSDKSPIDPDPSNCPLCQEFAHSGQFAHSVAVNLERVVATRFTVTFAAALPSLLATSHIWQGRAPPSH